MEDERAAVAKFLSDEVPILLEQLSVDDQPLWGIMTPQHMVEHLIVTYKMSIGRIKIPVISKEEDRPRLRVYLMKDSPMRRSVPSPTGNNELQPLRSATLGEAKQKLIRETEAFLEFVKAQPDFLADHPFGGAMRADEWLLFHRKHIKHHFIQFQLLPDYE
jgi:oxepin-CoA hydrolase/3-oxo-5,6-dehydrosuberyl-CoA semialdehyde dehydrogenase